MTKALWKPNQEMIKHCYMQEFINFVNHDFTNYSDLHKWSVEHPDLFWKAIWDFFEVDYFKPPEQIIKTNKKMQDTKWFVGAKLNFAKNLLRRDDQHIAIISTSERGEYHTYSYAALYHRVAKMAEKMRQCGLQPGDRVAAVLPNTPEAIIGMLATTSMGAVWSACSPDFGLQAIKDRFSQIEPKLLFVVDGHFYKGKTFLHHERNLELKRQLPTVENTILFQYIEPENKVPAHFINFTDCFLGDNVYLDFEELPFDHPVYILYSSGTTGKPKCMVHGAGGTLLQHLKELKLHTNVQPSSTIFFNCTTTWMMWHWLVSSLACGARIVLYEGAVFYPTQTALFDLIDKANINIFGVGAKYFEMCAKLKLKPKKKNKLSSLYTILTTASPLLPTSFDYVYENVKTDVRLSSMSGGSDIISCFALGNPMLPIYRGELQCIGLGMDVDIFDDNGKSIKEKKGELVCKSPFPAMPIDFWNDPDGKKYQNAYFNQFPNIWAHGDYAMITNHHGLIIYGRSDATLNPSGVRIGSAEIYQQVEQIPEITESVVVSQEWQGSERIILFVILRKNEALNEALITKIKTQIRDNTSPYHVPEKIITVEDIPRTPNGKISEISVKKAINNETINNTQALANPECLIHFKDIPELSH